MIHFEHIHKSYGSVRALDDVSMTVETGQILGLLGPNGAGKTTAMKIITCYMPPTSGRVTVDGLDVSDNPLAVRRKVGYLPENNPLYPEMGVTEYLGFCARLHGLAAAAVPAAIDRTIEHCGLGEYRHRFIGQLSKGFRQRVGLAQAIIHDPEVLILDEPTTGLDPNQIVEIRQLIRELGRAKTVILSTHIMQEVEATCSRMVIINRGRIIADGTPAGLRQQLTGAGSHLLEIRNGGDGVARRLKERLPIRDIVDQSAPGGDSLRLEIRGENGEDLRERLFRMAVEEGWTLLELGRTQTSLEDVFRELTTADERQGGPRPVNAIRAIYRRELSAYFNGPMAYLFISLFLLLTGWFFFSGFFLGGQADIRGALELVPLLFVFFVPALTMRLISEEKRSGTLELLVTYPVTDLQVILGKYLAALTLLCVAIAGTLVYTVTAAWLGNLDGGVAITGYLGMVLMGAAYTAIGMYASSLTDNPFVGFVLGIAFTLVLFLMDKVLWFIPASLVGLFEFLSIDTHYHSLIRGVVDSRDLVYYFSLIALGVLLASRSLARRTWN